MFARGTFQSVLPVALSRAASALAVVAVHDDLVIVQDRRGAKAVDAFEDAGPRDPLRFAGEVIRRDHHVLHVEERDVNKLPIGRGRAGRMAVLAVLLLQRRLHDGLRPENLARVLVEAEQVAALGIRHGLDNEQPVAPHDGRRVADGERGLPQHVLGAAPLHRDILLRARAVPARAAPRRPVLGEGTMGEREQDG